MDDGLQRRAAIGCGSLTPRERLLADQLAEALETIRQLREDMAPPAFDQRDFPGLTWRQALIVWTLRQAGGAPVRRSRLKAAICRSGEGNAKMVDLHIHRIRRRGYSVETVRGMGFRVPTTFAHPRNSGALSPV